MTSGGFTVPDWLIGTEDEVLRAVVATAGRWGKQYASTRTLPAPTLVDPGRLDRIIINTADMQPTRSAVRLFANCELIWKILDAAGPRDRLIVDYELHVGQAPWGAYETFTCLREPWSVSALQAGCRSCVLISPRSPRRQ